MSDAVTYELDGTVAVIRLDDGKANAYTSELLTALDEAIERADSEATALVLLGRPGRFCAGFDLAAMTASLEQMRTLVAQGARLLMRLYGLGVPTVAGCTGHALAAGALTLLACDVRIGADTPTAKLGLNEVAIGMGLPIFAVAQARDRISTRHLTEAVLGRVYPPAAAVDAGFLDRIVPADDVAAEAIAEGHRQGELRTAAVRQTKAHLRGATIAHVLSTLDADLAAISGPAPA